MSTFVLKWLIGMVVSSVDQLTNCDCVYVVLSHSVWRKLRTPTVQFAWSICRHPLGASLCCTVDMSLTSQSPHHTQLFLCLLLSVCRNMHTLAFNSPFSGTTRVSRYQKGKTNLDFTEARDREWQWHQLDHMQVCTSLQTDNHASTPLLHYFYFMWIFL